MTCKHGNHSMHCGWCEDQARITELEAHAQGLRERVAELEAQLARDELSPEFTDTSRAALLWVLWHHQGGSSPVGQPLRFALGMGAHDHLNENQIAEAKRWAEISGSTTADFHKHRELEAQRQWQPIETAPTSGYFMVYEDGAVRLRLRHDGQWLNTVYAGIECAPYGDVAVGQDAQRILDMRTTAGTYKLVVCDGCCDNPTHWMPLPPPPVERAHGIEPTNQRESA